MADDKQPDEKPAKKKDKKKDKQTGLVRVRTGYHGQLDGHPFYYKTGLILDPSHQAVKRNPDYYEPVKPDLEA